MAGGDGGETLSRVLRGRAFTRLGRAAAVDYNPSRLGRAAGAVDALVRAGSALLSYGDAAAGGGSAAAKEQAAAEGAGAASAEGGQGGGGGGRWAAALSLLKGDLDRPEFTAVAPWAAAQLAGCGVAVTAEAVEQCAGPDEAAALVGGALLGGLRPAALLVTTPNRCGLASMWRFVCML